MNKKRRKVRKVKVSFQIQYWNPWKNKLVKGHKDTSMTFFPFLYLGTSAIVQQIKATAYHAACIPQGHQFASQLFFWSMSLSQGPGRNSSRWPRFLDPCIHVWDHTARGSWPWPGPAAGHCSHLEVNQQMNNISENVNISHPLWDSFKLKFF